jgi:hypothetical protein
MLVIYNNILVAIDKAWWLLPRPCDDVAGFPSSFTINSSWNSFKNASKQMYVKSISVTPPLLRIDKTSVATNANGPSKTAS